MHIFLLIQFKFLPSISTSNWFSVFSCSECEPKFLPPLFLPTASISSINRMQGAFLRAIANMSLTRDGPTPTNISKNSDPDTVRKGTSASPAVALASKVLPVPGGPDYEKNVIFWKNLYCKYDQITLPVRIAPFGILAPRLIYCWGFFKKFTNSIISIFASSQPATSLNVNEKLIYSFSYSHTQGRILVFHALLFWDLSK